MQMISNIKVREIIARKSTAVIQEKRQHDRKNN